MVQKLRNAQERSFAQENVQKNKQWTKHENTKSTVDKRTVPSVPNFTRIQGSSENLGCSGQRSERPTNTKKFQLRQRYAAILHQCKEQK